MLWWVVFIVVLIVALTVLTLAWWRIGDQWADAEHKRFGPKAADRQAPTVIRTDRPDEGP
ncbi:MAG: hypothetical protein DHS20C14_20290 [Phycisphaeraceae bacterium]|nr:MAG: hypothetical protein DHS20C14_20290 [Phycisphaeraceae bacterium]